jgi:serine/threonine-protein kinase
MRPRLLDLDSQDQQSVRSTISMPIESGRVLAERYRLVRPVGQGSQASVWVAEHLALNTNVAVKLIDPELAKKEDALERFKREATAAAQLRSAHVVQILDHGVDIEQPFIVMELLDGEDLFERIQARGRLTLRETSKIVTQVARALTRAHGAGIVHRDLKPENVYLVPNEDDEIVKVLDFGVAKVADAKRTMQSTGIGTLIGTPHYMSPEQVKGIGEIDYRSDLWSLGVITFQCVTGELPFDSEGVGDLLLKITVGEMPVPSKVVKSLPATFDAWFAKACDREPSKRYDSARDMAEALARAVGISVDEADRVRKPPQAVPRPITKAAPAEPAPAPAPPPSDPEPKPDPRASVPLALTKPKVDLEDLSAHAAIDSDWPDPNDIPVEESAGSVRPPPAEEQPPPDKPAIIPRAAPLPKISHEHGEWRGEAEGRAKNKLDPEARLDAHHARADKPREGRSVSSPEGLDAPRGVPRSTVSGLASPPSVIPPPELDGSRKRRVLGLVVAGFVAASGFVVYRAVQPYLGPPPSAVPVSDVQVQPPSQAAPPPPVSTEAAPAATAVDPGKAVTPGKVSEVKPASSTARPVKPKTSASAAAGSPPKPQGGDDGVIVIPEPEVEVPKGAPKKPAPPAGHDGEP